MIAVQHMQSLRCNAIVTNQGCLTQRISEPTLPYPNLLLRIDLIISPAFACGNVTTDVGTLLPADAVTL